MTRNDTVTFDGRARALTFNSRAIGELEIRSPQHFGWYLNELLLQGRCGFAVSIWLLWAGLQHEAQPPSREDVEAMLDRFIASGGKLRDLRDPIAQAIERFLSPPPGNAVPGAESPSSTSGTAAG